MRTSLKIIGLLSGPILICLGLVYIVLGNQRIAMEALIGEDASALPQAQALWRLGDLFILTGIGVTCTTSGIVTIKMAKP